MSLAERSIDNSMNLRELNMQFQTNSSVKCCLHNITCRIQMYIHAINRNTLNQMIRA